MGEDEGDDRGGVLEAVGVMVDARFEDYLDGAPEFLITACEEPAVLRVGHDGIGFAADREDGDLGLGERAEVIDRVEGVGEGLCFGEVIGGLAAFPVRRGTLAFALAAGPAFEIADRGVEIDGGDAFGVSCGPVEGEETAPAEPFENGFGSESPELDEVIVKSIHGFERDRCAVEVLHVEIGDVEAMGEEGEIRLRLMPEELGAPDPGTAGGRVGGKDEKAIPVIDLEVDPFMPLPGGDPFRGPGRGGLQGEWGQKKENEAMHGDSLKPRSWNLSCETCCLMRRTGEDGGMRTASLVLALIMGSALVWGPVLPAQEGGGALSFNALSPQREAAMGIEQFELYKRDKKMVRSGPDFQAVQRVSARLVPVVKVPEAKWEFVLFEDDTPNAFALPGGKVGVHTGLFKVVRNDAQLAAVLGHELGHVTARHAGQRITQGVAGTAVGVVAGKLLEKKTGLRPEVAQGITQGAATLRLLKFSRGQELQADKLGASYMARAGYDPREAVDLWRRFAEYKAKSGGSGLPAFLSTHPVDERRIEELQAHLPTALAEMKKTAPAPVPVPPSSPLPPVVPKALRPVDR